MRKEFAVFKGNKLVSLHWTEQEAKDAMQSGQHVRWRILEKWIKVEYVKRAP